MAINILITISLSISFYFILICRLWCLVLALKFPYQTFILRIPKWFFSLPLALWSLWISVILILNVFYHDELRKIDCIILSSFFLTKLVKTGNGNFSILRHSYKPIKVQTCSASQNDCLNLSFVKDTYDNVKIMAKKVGKMVIYESQILGLTL